MADKITMTVQFANLTKSQALALEDLFRLWEQMGSWGTSRWTAFYADGDGNFRPKILVNGEKAKRCNLTNIDKRWTDGKEPRGEYRLDFDAIAWALSPESQ